MPVKVKVKMRSVDYASIPAKSGVEYDYVIFKGFDATNDRGFTKQCFATKKGTDTATKHAEFADTVNPGDWVEFTLDDSSNHNVMTMQKMAEPIGMSAPGQQTAAPQKGKGKAGGIAKKGEFRSVPQLNREVALKAAVAFLNNVAYQAAVDRPGENGVPDVLFVAKEFENYLVNGNPCCDVDGEKREKLANGSTIVTPTDESVPPPGDDDIPF